MKLRIKFLTITALVGLITFSCSHEKVSPDHVTSDIKNQSSERAGCHTTPLVPVNGSANVQVRLRNKNNQESFANFGLNKGQRRVMNLYRRNGFNNFLEEVSIESTQHALFSIEVFSRAHGGGSLLRAINNFRICPSNGDIGTQSLPVFNSGFDASSVIITRVE